MEKETLKDFHASISGASSEMRSHGNEADETRKAEQRLKSNSFAFLITGALALVGGGAAFLWAAGLNSGMAGTAVILAAILGLGTVLFGKIKFLRNIWGKASLNFPPLTMLRKKNDNSAKTGPRPFEEISYATKRLTKSESNKVIFGVCSGLAEYAGVSTGLMRIAFILAFFFSGGAMIFPYLVLTFALPALRKRDIS